MSEAFKPIAIRGPSAGPFAFALRCLVDVQLLTTYRFLKRALENCRGKVIDVGAGEAPWRELIRHGTYVGLDVDSAKEFGMRRNEHVLYYDGSVIPFPDGSFDHVLTSEVLEHVPNPGAFLLELSRVLRPGGSLILTVPWSARLHHLPHDYHRFTRYGLSQLLRDSGFIQCVIEERGNDIAVIANKLIVVNIRLIQLRPSIHKIWEWPLALLLSPITALFLLAAHVSMVVGAGGKEDPLGYGVVAIKGQ